MPPPFIALWAYLSGPLPFGSTLELSIDGSPFYIELIKDTPTLYVSVDGDALTIDAITLTSGDGSTFSSALPLTLSGAFGFTLHVDNDSVMAASDVVELTEP